MQDPGNRTFGIVALLLAMLTGGCATSPAARLTADIAGLNKEMEARLRAGDLVGVAAIYADDGVLIGPSGVIARGREEIDAYWLRFEDPVDWRLEVLSVEGERDLAVQRGRSTLVRGRGANRKTSVVDFELIWIRRPDGEYRIMVDAYW